MVKITAAVTESWIKANERAHANRQAGRVVRWVAPNTYQCPSSKGDGTVYTQRILNVGQLAVTCDCPHGQHGTAGRCWHSAAALSAEVRRVADPHSAEAVASRAHREMVNAKMARFARQ